MYKIFKDVIILFSALLIALFTLWYINTYSNAIPGSNVQFVNVRSSKSNLPQELEKIAEENHVLIAKQIFTPSDNAVNASSGKFTFEKFGKGKLPTLYPEEKNPQILSVSNNDTNYVLIGKNLTAKKLSQELTALGNTTLYFTQDMRTAPIELLVSNYQILILILLATFCALLLGEHIMRLKKDSIQRLAGVKKSRLAFQGLFKSFIFALLAFSLSLIGAVFYLVFSGKLDFGYFESIFLALLLGFIVIMGATTLISVVVFSILQRQTINLSLQGKTPYSLLVLLIFAFQGFAIIASMNSLNVLNKANQQISLLQSAQNEWKSNKQYFAPTMIAQGASASPKDGKRLLLNLMSQSDILLAANPFSQIEVAQAMGSKKALYMPGLDSNAAMNVFYVNQNFLNQDKIKISKALRQSIQNFKAGDYAMLIPKSQKSNSDILTTFWSNTNNSEGLTSTPIVDYYDDIRPIFGYSVMKNQSGNQSFAQSPIIFIYGEKTFEAMSNNTAFSTLLMYLENGYLLTTNRTKVKNSFKDVDYQAVEGSFYNGYYTIMARLTVQNNQRNLLYLVNTLCIVSSLLLIFLINSIYLYQNRKEFLIQRLAGKSWLDIHMIYLAVVVILVALISFVARFWLHVPNEAFVVPAIYLLLVFSLFAVQVRRERRANVLYLKGL